MFSSLIHLHYTALTEPFAGNGYNNAPFAFAQFEFEPVAFTGFAMPSCGRP